MGYDHSSSDDDEGLNELDEDGSNFGFVPKFDGVTFRIDNQKLKALPFVSDNVEFLSCSYNFILFPGLNSFSNLKKLNIRHNRLSTLSQLPDCLEYLDVSHNCLKAATYFPSPRKLKYLNVSNCSISRMPKLPDNLQVLNADNNTLRFISYLPDSLELLHCSNNIIIQLDNIPPNLLRLDCSSNNLKSIIIPPKLQVLICDKNQITDLPPLGSSNLITMDISETLIERIHSLPPRLRDFTSLETPIESLPALPITLKVFSIDDDELKSLNGQPLAHYTRREGTFNMQEYREVHENDMATIIQRGCHRWLYESTCRDGTVGILFRLEVRRLRNIQ